MIQMDKTHQRQADAAVWTFKTVHSGDVKCPLKMLLEGVGGEAGGTKSEGGPGEIQNE